MMILGDCINELAKMDANSIHSIVTDPPYGIGFLGEKWDSDVPAADIWAECLRVLKPGGFLVSFAATRTQHRMAVALEDAGFELRDTLMWLFNTGFPRSQDISKRIDKELGMQREQIRVPFSEARIVLRGNGKVDIPGSTRPWLDNARKRGYHEKDGGIPVSELAKKYHGWGTALKPAYEPILLCRKPIEGTVAGNTIKHGTGGLNIAACKTDDDKWPTNILHDGTIFAAGTTESRIFSRPKASKADRDDDVGNLHPTVKPTSLMRWLIRLTTDVDGVVLDPFAGSGSTGKAAILEHRKFIGIEKNAEYCTMAKARLQKTRENMPLL